MTYASNKKAAELADTPVGTFVFEGHTYDLNWNETSVVVMDDELLAERMAEHLGTSVKHSRNRNPSEHWLSISLVRLT